MRRGKLERSFDSERVSGLAELLAGNASLDEAIRPTRIASLSFISAGKRPDNPSELLMSPRLQQYFDGLLRNFDAIIVDTPPVLAVTDASIIGKLAGTNFLVLAFGGAQRGRNHRGDAPFAHGGHRRAGHDSEWHAAARAVTAVRTMRKPKPTSAQ